MLQTVCIRIVNSAVFKTLVLITILLAGAEEGLNTYPELARRYAGMLHILDRYIIVVFVVEIILKLIAEGRRFWRFFNDGWNIFDFVIVVTALLPLDLEFIAILRMLRIFRVLRLITVLPRLRFIVEAILHSIPSMGYIFLLLLLHFYIYAAIGTTLFAENDAFHFRNLHTSMVTLFRVATLEGWSELMYINIYGCDVYKLENVPCPSPDPQPYAAVAYFVSFVITGSLIIINLFIGVVVNGMEELQRSQQRNLPQHKNISHEQLMDEAERIEHELAELHQNLSALNKRLRKAHRKGIGHPRA